MSTHPIRMWVLRRSWWATLPYYGWVYGGEGGVPSPWYAHPPAWAHRFVEWLLRNQDVFGPRFARDHIIVGAPRWKPWQ